MSPGHGMGEQCWHCYKEVRRPQNMHRSMSVEPSPKKRNTSAADSRRPDARAGSSKDILNRRSYRGILALCTWRQVQSPNHLPNPLWRIPVEKTSLIILVCQHQARYFQKRVTQALEGLEGILNITDDILVYGVGDTKDEVRCDHDRKLEPLLLKCREHGIALNKNKLKLWITEVPFMGHLFPKQGLKIDPDKAKRVCQLLIKVSTLPSRPHGATMPSHRTRHRI